ncbi:phage holin family protein [Actinomadura viridis]|uniref:Superfamily III holin-X n=1 Tax=Actinomadura viridis TaxID=58110 RepID=A0A931GSC9_9ACTN|nr:phage holin family protein [Actinomadura viridis]MBG6093801.1 hypothetical protein [Actinomadura viridis]
MSTVRPLESGERATGTMIGEHPGGDGATAYRTAGRGAGDQKVGELVSRATQQLSDLVRAELRLAAAEIKDKGKHAGAGAGLFGGAGVMALYGGGALVAAAIAAISLALPVWAAALIIGGFLLLVAGILALMGRSQTSRGFPPMPERALESARQDMAEIRERAHR